jgi:UDP-N-acetylenolpyruvoylglucosamine reductase
MEAVRQKAREEGVLRPPTQEELDQRRAEELVYQGKVEAVRNRIAGILREEGLEITVIGYGSRVVLTDGKSGGYLALDDGTWH